MKRKPRFGKKKARARSWVKKKFRPGFRGYPIATVAFYGPYDKLATKVVVRQIDELRVEAARLLSESERTMKHVSARNHAAGVRNRKSVKT